MRQRTPATISDSELDVLKALWEVNGPTTVRDLAEMFADDERDWAYTTVQTLLNRLVEKGFAETGKAGRALVYTPLVTMDDLVGMQLGEIADRVCEGNSSPLVLNLAKTASFTRDEIDSFRQLLDELEENAKGTKADTKSNPKKKGAGDAELAN